MAPTSVAKYLQSKFGDKLPEARSAMEDLAHSRKPDDLAKVAFQLYEAFRHEVPADEKGWGAKGKLDLDTIRQLITN